MDDPDRMNNSIMDIRIPPPTVSAPRNMDLHPEDDHITNFKKSLIDPEELLNKNKISRAHIDRQTD